MKEVDAAGAGGLCALNALRTAHPIYKSKVETKTIQSFNEQFRRFFFENANVHLARRSMMAKCADTSPRLHNTLYC